MTKFEEKIINLTMQELEKYQNKFEKCTESHLRFSLQDFIEDTCMSPNFLQQFSVNEIADNWEILNEEDTFDNEEIFANFDNVKREIIRIVTNRYLSKIIDIYDITQNWWKNLSEEEKIIIKQNMYLIEDTLKNIIMYE